MVVESIKNFGFKNPIVVDKNHVIINGHTRLKAAYKLKLEEAPVIIADDLTEDQANAFRLVDNKTSELAEWDFQKLEEELANINIDMAEYGFIDNERNFNHIDELLENNFSSIEEARINETFNITFTFDVEHKEALTNYIKQNGKDKIVQMILSEVENNGY